MGLSSDVVTLSDLSDRQLQEQLTTDGIVIQTGAFLIHLRSRLAPIFEHIKIFYADYPVYNTDFADFHVRIDHPPGLRRWIKSQVYFYLDERVPFKPLPASQACPMLEWGLNWCIANYAHQYLIIHAAALEKNGCGVLLPALPGSGKSTLTAALMLRGWRLLSDELGIIETESGNLMPLARPVNLKNESINIIRDFSQDAMISPAYKDTNKGTVSLVRANPESVEMASQKVKQCFVIEPKYLPESTANLTPVSRGNMFMHVAENSFNYSVLAKHGYDVMTRLIEGSKCYSFVYSRLEDAVRIFDDLVDAQHAR